MKRTKSKVQIGVKRNRRNHSPRNGYVQPEASRFIPHAFETQIGFINTQMPRILLTPEVYEDMFILTDEVHKEVAWLGTVEQNGNDFIITEIFLLEQDTHSTTAEITPEGLAKFGMDLIDNRADGEDVFNKIRFWGHSHVNMDTSASGQDEDQMNVFEEGCAYFIRAIVNKRGRMEFTLFLYDEGLRINDLSWGISTQPDGSRRTHWQAEIDEKVGEASAGVAYTGHYVSPMSFYQNGNESLVDRFLAAQGIRQDFDVDDLHSRAQLLHQVIDEEDTEDEFDDEIEGLDEEEEEV